MPNSSVSNPWRDWELVIAIKLITIVKQEINLKVFEIFATNKLKIDTNVKIAIEAEAKLGFPTVVIIEL